MLLLLALMACKKENQTSEVNLANQKSSTTISISTKEAKNGSIVLGKAEKRKMSDVVQTNGILDVPPQNLVSLTAIFGGYIRDVKVLQGMKVKKGQLLGVLENPEFLTLQQDYLECLAKLDFMRIDYERQEELIKNDIGSKREYQEVKSNFLVMQARSNSLAEKLKMLDLSISNVKKGQLSSKIKILSPINGYVTAINVNMGSFVMPQTIMFEIADTDHLHAELYLYEKDILKIKKGQAVKIVLANDLSTEYYGKVFLINKKIEDDRTVRVHVHFDKHDINMIPGTYIKAFISIKETEEWALPEKAFVNADDKQFVFLELKPGEYQQMEVKKGIAQNGFNQFILVEDLNLANSKFVVNGAFSIHSKMKNTSDE